MVVNASFLCLIIYMMKIMVPEFSLFNKQGFELNEQILVLPLLFRYQRIYHKLVIEGRIDREAVKINKGVVELDLSMDHPFIPDKGG